MEKSAAFGVLMWLGGVAVATGLTGSNYLVTACGIFLSLAALIYYRRIVDAE